MDAQRLMRRALVEAEKGRGRTRPNPIVGALVVRHGRVIAAGHHEKAGGPHAEVVALRGAGARARGADMVVTLEPHDHTGRTSPCTLAIIEAGIRRVFIGSIDPNPLVAGRGVQRLRAAGLEVEVGVLAEACAEANRAWFKFITEKLPWVVLKAAATLDGKLATRTGDSRWVTGPAARARVHALRNELDGVVVGIGTALADDPRLTVRAGASQAASQTVGQPGVPLRDPVRIVVDSRARLPPTARMLRQRSAAVTLLACTARAPKARVDALAAAGAEILRCRADAAGRVDLRDLLRKLAACGLTSVLVEGGAALHGGFLSRGLWDELQLFLAPSIAGGDGLSWAGFPGPARMAEARAVAVTSTEWMGKDLLVTARRPR